MKVTSFRLATPRSAGPILCLQIREYILLPTPQVNFHSVHGRYIPSYNNNW